MSNNPFVFVIFAVVTVAVGAEQAQLEIVEDRQKRAPAESSQDVGRRFDPATLCSPTGKPSTIRSALGINAMTLIVHDYDRRVWTDFATVQRYVRRLLDGQPEGGTLEGNVYWSEYRRVEIAGSIQFRNGQRRRAAFANGYAHVEDESGCQWWGRYLGPDRTRWIVRSP